MFLYSCWSKPPSKFFHFQLSGVSITCNKATCAQFVQYQKIDYCVPFSRKNAVQLSLYSPSSGTGWCETSPLFLLQLMTRFGASQPSARLVCFCLLPSVIVTWNETLLLLWSRTVKLRCCPSWPIATVWSTHLCMKKLWPENSHSC